ncbi:hypothetical protein MKW92_024232 [Papaver armeniacum]|nr:hypothetical protein MKW92_024232 [Papaver armeniacum]
MNEKQIFDLNKDPVSEDSDVTNSFEPFVGQCFLSEQEAYVFYQKYAIKHGFSIRKGSYKKDTDGDLKTRNFYCHREGFTKPKVVQPSKIQRNRASTRCKCDARMRIRLYKAFDIFPEEWHVVQFDVKHNHDLLTPKQVRFLPANRNINKGDEDRILLLNKAGLSIRELVRVMELEKNVQHGGLPFLDSDIRNFLYKDKRTNTINDASELLEYCKTRKQHNPNFHYVYSVDEKNKLEHFFWCPNDCFEWYKKFGDVVVFDTTYKVNSYEMPFGIFVGVNNHGKTILFGCALLRNETIKAFQWLMKTFVSVMGKPPITILTDQDPWLTIAISTELPSTKHSFCIWHITAKFSGWFLSVLRGQYFEWCSDFYKLYRSETQEEFEDEWPITISKYKLNDNKNVIGLYNARKFWVPAYLRDYFFGGMTTTGRSESINAFIKRFINSHTTLREFLNQVDLAIETIKNKETHDSMLEKHHFPISKIMSPLEEQVRKILTPYAYNMFREELERASQYGVYRISGSEYMLKYFEEGKNTKRRRVFWDGQVIICSCKQFEFCGIVCRHILHVFIHTGCFKIPITCLPFRWHRDDLCDEQVNSLHNNAVAFQEEIVRDVVSSNAIAFQEEIVRDVVADPVVVDDPPPSVTKGRRRGKSAKRLKGGRELAKQKRVCSFCKLEGHYRSTCPTELIEKSGGKTSFSKKKKVTAEDLGINPIFCVKY